MTLMHQGMTSTHHDRLITQQAFYTPPVFYLLINFFLEKQPLHYQLPYHKGNGACTLRSISNNSLMLPWPNLSQHHA